jgi:hypothetical protein
MDRSPESAVEAAVAEFDTFDGRAWFNTAHQGPLTHTAVEATKQAAVLLLAQLVNGVAEQIVLGNMSTFVA